jgi:uncharacterized OsmC-like protein
MNGDELRALQAPIKEKYKADPASARVTLTSRGAVDRERLACTVATSSGNVVSGLHPAAGGPAGTACSGDMLLDALVACAGVTFSAVATAMNVPFRRATISAEGDWDVRGTLGVSREAPIGIPAIRLSFDIDSDAPAEQIDKLIQLTERYCVILQTLKQPPVITAHRV